MIHFPAFTAGIMLGRPEVAAGMLLGVAPQPVRQGGVRVLWCGRNGFVALGDAVLPGDAAGEPFADPSTPAGDEWPLAGVPGLEVAVSDLSQCVLLQLGVSEQSLEGGVFASRSLRRLASSALSPPNWLRHR